MSNAKEAQIAAATKARYLTRDAILHLLSDEEVATVSLAETRTPVDGEHYVDLEHPERGVRQFHTGARIQPKNLLLQSAVREATWKAVLAQLGGE